MFMNLAASWKSLGDTLAEDPEDFTDEEIELMRKAFFCGAWATLNVYANILREHEGEARLILIRALWAEAMNAVREFSE
jgi:hypothetical protein